MPFKRILESLTKATGGKGAVMLNSDGEVVASCSESASIDIELIGAHYGIILDAVRDAAHRIDGSAVEAVSITTSIYRLAIYPIKDDHYVMVMLDKARPFGKLSMELKKSARMIEKEM